MTHEFNESARITWPSTFSNRKSGLFQNPSRIPLGKKNLFLENSDRNFGRKSNKFVNRISEPSKTFCDTNNMPMNFQSDWNSKLNPEKEQKLMNIRDSFCVKTNGENKISYLVV